MKKVILSGVAGLGMVASQAQAAVAVEVTAALTEAAADVGTVGAAVLVAIVAAAAFRYVRRAL